MRPPSADQTWLSIDWVSDHLKVKESAITGNLKSKVDLTLFKDKISNLDKKVVFDFTDNYLDAVEKNADNKTKAGQFKNFNDNFSKLSKKLVAGNDTIERKDYKYMFKSVDNLVDKLTKNRNSETWKQFKYWFVLGSFVQK